MLIFFIDLVVLCLHWNKAYRVGLNSGVDKVKAFLDLSGYWRRSREVVALDSESVLVGGVLHGDDLAIGSGVAVGTLLNQGGSLLVLTDSLQVTLFLGVDVVAGLIARKLQTICLVSIIIFTSYISLQLLRIQMVDRNKVLSQ